MRRADREYLSRGVLDPETAAELERRFGQQVREELLQLRRLRRPTFRRRLASAVRKAIALCLTAVRHRAAPLSRSRPASAPDGSLRPECSSNPPESSGRIVMASDAESIRPTPEAA